MALPPFWQKQKNWICAWTHRLQRKTATRASTCVWTAPRIRKAAAISAATAFGSITLCAITLHQSSQQRARASLIAKQSRQLRRFTQTERQFQRMQSNLNGAFTKIARRVNEPAAPFLQLVARAQHDIRLLGASCKIGKREKCKNGTKIAFTLHLTSLKDADFTPFLHRLEHSIPGVIVYEMLEITRLDKVRTRKEFLDFLEQQKKSRRRSPNFSAMVTGHVLLAEHQVELLFPPRRSTTRHQ